MQSFNYDKIMNLKAQFTRRTKGPKKFLIFVLGSHSFSKLPVGHTIFKLRYIFHRHNNCHCITFFITNPSTPNLLIDNIRLFSLIFSSRQFCCNSTILSTYICLMYINKCMEMFHD